MPLKEYNWPECYPEGVPSEDSVAADGEVYRLVDEIPPKSKDFQMYIDDNPHCKLKNEQKKFLYGVSFWSTKEAVQEVKRRYPRPNQFGNKKIALISFTKELGKMVVDQPSRNHISLWKQFGHCPSSCFVKEEL